MNKTLNKTTPVQFMARMTPFSPQQFADHCAEQKHLREQWLIRKTNEVNEILIKLAGGLPQKSMLNMRNELDPDYIDYMVNRSDSPEHRHINKDTILIFIDLGSSGVVVDNDLMSDFAKLFIRVGWGPNTSAHIRACHNYDVWLALEPVADLEEDEEEDE